ncbi:ATP-binding protein [Halorubellus salinus]|uniref:ATP-binding protein n=1 Tax=Halorubellus salinus TaxID=755309 RepID=UPI001D06FB89|nr:helicase HerA-like domain-containing protein [Halorubellus salinus]
MPGPNVTTKHVKYVERAFLDDAGSASLAGSQTLGPEPGSLQLWQVRSIPDHDWDARTNPLDGISSVLTGLAGAGNGIGLAVVGDRSGVSVYLATWPATTDATAAGTTTGAESAARAENAPDGTTGGGGHEAAGRAVPLDDLLAGAYPGIELDPVASSTLASSLDPLTAGAVVTGSPATPLEFGTDRAPGRELDADTGVGLDRLIRSLGSDSWAYVVSASPVSSERVEGLSDRTLNELRSVQTSVQRAEGETPIASAYQQVLDGVREKLAAGRASGAWHTVGYLLTEDRTTRDRACAVATGAFGGVDSHPDPIRTIPAPDVASLAADFAIPAAAGPDAPGTFEYPYRYPTVLCSVEVAAMLHLPTRETSGFHVRPQPQFDVTPHGGEAGKAAVSLGTILDEGRPTDHEYDVPIADLNRHGLVVGTTGSGKTNTVFHVLRQLADRDVPFLVVEPAKTEYRRLLDSELGDDLQVFTLGDETTAPFRINPFEIRPGVSVSSHIDHLTALFNATFVMYAPMPYILERAIHEVYEDRGWDLVTGTNRRGHHPKAQPTITDLYEKIDPVVDSLGYDQEITQDVSAALKTRLDNLRIGSKGLLLDTHTSVPIEDLLGQPTVLELDAVGNDDEKAFLMGLVLFSLYEHYQSSGAMDAAGASLNHVTVVEEAHRLLSASSSGGPESSNKAGQAVESFTNLLAEIRAYGEGALVVDQTPAKLAPSVVKNTNLKVVHRLLADDDRRLLGGSMGASAEQTRWLGLSRVGEAAVFSGADDNPILVDVPFRKVDVERDASADAGAGGAADESLEARIRAQAERTRNAHPEKYEAYPWVAADGTTVRRLRREVRPMVDTPAARDALARTVHATSESLESVDASASALLDAVAGEVPRARLDDLAVPALVVAIETHFESLGESVDAPYETIQDLKASFATVLADALADDARIQASQLAGTTAETAASDAASTGASDAASTGPVTPAGFAERYADVFAVQACPCMSYEAVDGGCRYSVDAQRLVAGGVGDDLTDALAASTDGLWKRVSGVASDAADRFLPADASATTKWRGARCVAVQAAAEVDTIDAALQAKLVDGIGSVLAPDNGDEQ